MSIKQLSNGTVHKLPNDLRTILAVDTSLMSIWNSLTPLGRNEWICLVTSAKSTETRQRRIKRTIDQLKKGMRRPCCWEGCPHREKNGH